MSVALKDLLITPCECLVHLTDLSEDIESFPDVLKASSFSLWFLENASYLLFKDLLNESTQQNTIAEYPFYIAKRLCLADAQRLKKAKISEPFSGRSVKITDLLRCVVECFRLGEETRSAFL